MRQYVRPFLFAVARLGLFCVVVTWITAQSSTWLVSIPLDEREAAIEVGPRGYLLDLSDPMPVFVSGIEPSVRSYPVNERPMDDGFYPGVFGEHHRDGSVTHTLNIPGVVLGRFLDAFTFVSFRHWFMVAVCAVFYGMLKWVYRNRAGPVETSTTGQ